MAVVLRKPVITEKMTQMADKRQYAFEVNLDASKIAIAKTIEKKFNVKVDSIRTVIVKGKSKVQTTRRGRFEGKGPDRKKAIVTLVEGDKIELVETT